MMGKLGFDIRINEMSETEQQFCHDAVATYKRLAPVISEGDQYRLQSPYESDHAAILYADPSRSSAVLFAFDIHPRYRENISRLRLAGLDPDKTYRLEEINRMPAGENRRPMRPNPNGIEGKTYTGEYLMNVGIDVFSATHLNSRVIEIKEAK